MGKSSGTKRSVFQNEDKEWLKFRDYRRFFGNIWRNRGEKRFIFHTFPEPFLGYCTSFTFDVQAKTASVASIGSKFGHFNIIHVRLAGLVHRDCFLWQPANCFS